VNLSFLRNTGTRKVIVLVISKLGLEILPETKQTNVRFNTLIELHEYVCFIRDTIRLSEVKRSMCSRNAKRV